jgi:mono/diheme cytochrome c family protein
VRRSHLPPFMLLVLLPFALACQTNASDTRRWRASDHDQADLGQNVTAPSASAGSMAETSSPHTRDGSTEGLAMRAWIGKCMSCHGQIGAGDGPAGPASGARNLTDETWQSAVTDQGIADVIQHGRGRMPAFALEADVVDGLVKLVRQMGGHGRASPAPIISSDPLPPKRPTNP